MPCRQWCEPAPQTVPNDTVRTYGRVRTMQALDMTNVYAFHAYNDARAESALATGTIPSRDGVNNPFVRDPTSARNVEAFRNAIDERTKAVVEAQPHMSADALDRWYAKDGARREDMTRQSNSLHADAAPQNARLHRIETPQLEDFRAEQALRLHQAMLSDLKMPTKVAMDMRDANREFTPATPDTTAAAKARDDRRMDDMVAAVASAPAVRDRARDYVRNIEPIGSANAGSDRSHTPTRNKSDYGLDI